MVSVHCMSYVKSPLMIIFSRMNIWKNKESPWKLLENVPQKSLKSPWKRYVMICGNHVKTELIWHVYWNIIGFKRNQVVGDNSLCFASCVMVMLFVVLPHYILLDITLIMYDWSKFSNCYGMTASSIISALMKNSLPSLQGRLTINV